MNDIWPLLRNPLTVLYVALAFLLLLQCAFVWICLDLLLQNYLNFRIYTYKDILNSGNFLSIIHFKNLSRSQCRGWEETLGH